MSIHRRAAKRDAAEPDIIEALEKAGAFVYRLNQPVDLLVQYRGWHLLEVKTPGNHAGKAGDKRQEAQAAFCKAFNVPVVRTPDEALEAIGARHRACSEFRSSSVAESTEAPAQK